MIQPNKDKKTVFTGLIGLFKPKMSGKRSTQKLTLTVVHHFLKFSHSFSMVVFITMDFGGAVSSFSCSPRTLTLQPWQKEKRDEIQGFLSLLFCIFNESIVWFLQITFCFPVCFAWLTVYWTLRSLIILMQLFISVFWCVTLCHCGLTQTLSSLAFLLYFCLTLPVEKSFVQVTLEWLWWKRLQSSSHTVAAAVSEFDLQPSTLPL